MAINPTQKQIAILKERYRKKPFVMVNCLKFKNNGDSTTFRKLYHEYTNRVAPLIDTIGARVIFMGNVNDIFIGNESDIWDEVVLVHYPSGDAFLQMIAMEEYQDANRLREQALEKAVLLVSQRIL